MTGVVPTDATGMTAASNGRRQQLTPDMDMIAANLLKCQGCHEVFNDPCVLSCFHTLCARCARARTDPQDNCVICTLCGSRSLTSDDSSLPPRDELVSFLLQTSSDDFPRCANCDRHDKSPVFYCNTCVCWSSQRECDHLLSLINQETGITLGEVSAITMFYCNTCGQALCGPCREDTHKAKMFSQHDIIPISMKTKKHNQRCTPHGEIVTMFCTSNRTLLCMKCFSEASLEARLHCVDIDIAYEQAKKKLELSILNLKELQTSLNNAASLLQSTLEGVGKNMNQQREEIHTTYSSLIETLRKQYEAAIRGFDNEYQARSKHLIKELRTVSTSLPLVQSHLLLCSIIAARASKYEFLGMSTPMLERLNVLSKQAFPSKVPSPDELKPDFKETFISSLEDILQDLRDSDENESRPRSQSSLDKQRGRHEEGNYFNKCSHVLRLQLESLNEELSNIRGQISVMHKEISTKRSLSSSRSLTNLNTDCLSMKDSLDKVRHLVDEQNRVLMQIWEEDQRRILSEQDIFKKQVNELKKIHKDLNHIITISTHLSNFIQTGAIAIENKEEEMPTEVPVTVKSSISKTLPVRRKNEPKEMETHRENAQNTLPRISHRQPGPRLSSFTGKPIPSDHIRTRHDSYHSQHESIAQKRQIDADAGQHRSDSRLSYCSDDLPDRDAQEWREERQTQDHKGFPERGRGARSTFHGSEMTLSTILSSQHLDQSRIEEFLRKTSLGEYKKLASSIDELRREITGTRTGVRQSASGFATLARPRKDVRGEVKPMVEQKIPRVLTPEHHLDHEHEIEVGDDDDDEDENLMSNPDVSLLESESITEGAMGPGDDQSSDTNSMYNPSGGLFGEDISPYDTIVRARQKVSQQTGGDESRFLEHQRHYHAHHDETCPKASRRSSAPEIDQDLPIISSPPAMALQSRSLDHLKEAAGSSDTGLQSDSSDSENQFSRSTIQRLGLGGSSVQALVHRAADQQQEQQQQQHRLLRSTLPSKVPPHHMLKKSDSFEGHEETVRTIVQALQETRLKK